MSPGTLFAAAAGVVLAAANCVPEAMAETKMDQKFEESIVSFALLSNGRLMTRYENEETGAFSLLITNPNTEMTCMVFSGHHWKQVPSQLSKDPEA